MTWTKKDFLEKIQEAMKPAPLAGQGGIQSLKDKLLAFRAGQNSGSTTMSGGNNGGVK